jgi:predicted TIM-barrel fold metal-dependent hydrolase
VGHTGRAIVDTIASAIGHGLCGLKIAPIENGSGWVRGLLDDMEGAYAFNPQLFEEHPVEVFKRNIFVHPFHEEDPKGLIELLGADNVLFGSDYPHPEGMSDPLCFVDDLEGLPQDDVAKVMGGNLARLMNVA